MKSSTVTGGPRVTRNYLNKFLSTAIASSRSLEKPNTFPTNRKTVKLNYQLTLNVSYSAAVENCLTE